MAGYSVNVQPEQISYLKTIAEDNICSPGVHGELQLQTGVAEVGGIEFRPPTY